jgi:DNA replication protein DnaC
MMQQTLDRLYDLKLKGMAGALEDQLRRGHASELSFEERLTLLVEQQWMLREQQRTGRRLKSACLKQNACAEDIDYRHPRGLDRGVMEDLLTCSWIRTRRNVILTGATGLGKTWLACALADRACRGGLTAQYYRVMRLTTELALARADGSYLKLLDRLARVELLVLDDWGLSPLEGQAQHDLLELVDDRAGKRSMLVTSQLPVSKWHVTVGDPSVADALLDRIIGTAQQIALKGRSMRKSDQEPGSINQPDTGSGH